MIKKILLFFISLVIGTGLLVWIIHFVGWQEIKNAFLVFTGWQGLVILGLTVLMIVFAILRWREILKSQSHNIPMTSLAGPYLSWFSLVYLAPMMFFSTEAFRGYVLREKFSIPWAQGIASIIIDRILDWTIYLIVFFFGIVFLFVKIGLPPKDIGLILAVVFVFFSVAIGFFYFKGFKKQSIVKFFIKHFNNKKHLDAEPLEAEKEIFKFLDLKERFFWKAAVFTFLKTGTALVRVWFLIFFLGETIGFFSALPILGFHYVAMLIPIPAHIGSHEAIQVFVFGAINLRASAAAAFTMIIRGAELIIALVGITILFQLGVNLLRKVLLKKNNSADKNEV